MLGTSTGASQATVSRVLKTVTNAIRCRAAAYISFPDETDAIRQTKLCFSQFGFPNVIGTIDKLSTLKFILM